MKEYLLKKRAMVQKKLNDIQEYLDRSKVFIYGKNCMGNSIEIGFKYSDRKPTKSNGSIRYKVDLRNRLKRKIRRIDKKLHTA